MPTGCPKKFAGAPAKASKGGGRGKVPSLGPDFCVLVGLVGGLFWAQVGSLFWSHAVRQKQRRMVLVISRVHNFPLQILEETEFPATVGPSRL